MGPKEKLPSEEFPSSNSGLFTPEPRTGAQSDLGIADFNLSKGLEELQGRRNLLIYMHDNPDPDAMAAAMGIKHLVECTTDLNATLAWGESSAAPKTAPWSKS
jgi:formylmethanofuran dehydrogenase subunit B